jgi:hypothetical protein
VREKVLDRTLHRAVCPACGRRVAVESRFVYVDARRGTFVEVLPPRERHRWKEASRSLWKAVDEAKPLHLGAPRRVRVAFGLEELREKIVAEDAGLDDRMTEVLKVLAISDHPVLVQRPRLNLHLDAVRDDALRFLATYEHSPREFEVTVPRSLAEDVLARRDEVVEWVGEAHEESVFALPEAEDAWVSVRRWAPGTSALSRLETYAAAAAAGKSVRTETKAFRSMLDRLPRGAHLSPWAKKALRALEEYARRKKLPSLEESLLEIRFDLDLEDEWAINDDPDDIDSLWKLLETLPDFDVAGNVALREIELVSGSGGYYGGGVVSIGERELGSGESFEDVVRHEVGHAVQDRIGLPADTWLTEKFGWRMFDPRQSATAVDDWVELMGGWRELSAQDQALVREVLVMAVGTGSKWGPPALPVLPSGHPWLRSAFAPRLAFQSSRANWWEEHASWLRVKKRVFFVNYWYATLCAVDEATLALVDRMPDPYAAMSPFEFFAELYSLHHDTADPLHANVPAHARKWFDKNVTTGVAVPEPGTQPARPDAIGNAFPRYPLPPDRGPSANELWRKGSAWKWLTQSAPTRLAAPTIPPDSPLRARPQPRRGPRP